MNYSDLSFGNTPRHRRFNQDEFHQMRDLGWFIDQRVELIDGQIIQLPHPANPHCISTDRTAEALRSVFGKENWVRMQMALDLSSHSEPYPDVAVIKVNRDCQRITPTTARLVIEVGDDSLNYDRGIKAGSYARAGIADYWIVNLIDCQLEIYRKPQQNATRPRRFTYADVTILKPGDFAKPLAATQARIAVADVLPK